MEEDKKLTKIKDQLYFSIVGSIGSYAVLALNAYWLHINIVGTLAAVLAVASMLSGLYQLKRIGDYGKKKCKNIYVVYNEYVSNLYDGEVYAIENKDRMVNPLCTMESELEDPMVVKGRLHNMSFELHALRIKERTDMRDNGKGSGTVINYQVMFTGYTLKVAIPDMSDLLIYSKNFYRVTRIKPRSAGYHRVGGLDNGGVVFSKQSIVDTELDLTDLVDTVNESLTVKGSSYEYAVWLHDGYLEAFIHTPNIFDLQPDAVIKCVDDFLNKF